MTHLQTRAQQLIEAGYYVAPANEYALLTPDVDPRKTPYTAAEAARGSHINIYHGAQRDGLILSEIDLDSHKPGQNADAARAAFTRAHPDISRKIDWKRSRGGKGWHGWVRSYKRLPGGPIYDQDGNHIGELLARDTDRSIDPGDIAPGVLNQSEIERLLDFWTVRSADPAGERWSDRAKQGATLAAGWKRIAANRQQLRAHLVTNCGMVGKHLDTLFDERGPFNRSDAAGNLYQTLMLFAHKLPCGWASSPDEKHRYVMAYWMASDSYGKASDKDYNQEKDGCSLAAQIVHEDTKLNGKRWICPFWAKGSTTIAPAAAPKVEPEIVKQPAHRPKGDQEKHLATFRRVLEAIEPDDWGRRVYTLDCLADKMTAARCPAKPRTIQAYLRTLRGAGEIVTAQIGGNGRPYAVLTCQFGGADKSEKPDRPAEHAADPGGANENAIERAPMPQSADLSPQCIEDHQNPGAPTAAAAPPPAPGGAQPFGVLPLAPAGARVGGELRGWVSEAFDAYPGRASLRKVRKHVEMLAEGRSFSLDALVRLYGQERDRRQRERQIAKLPAMKFGKLKVLSRRIERILAEGKEGPDGACYGWACWLHPYVEAEFDRRMEAKERLRTGQRRGATVDQALLLAEIEPQRRATAAPKRTPRGACVSPNLVAAVVQPGLFADMPPVPGTRASLLASIRRIQSPPTSG